MADERDPRNRFRNEEADEENEEEAYEEVETNGRGALIGFLILFIVLFLISTGLLFYYQFYQGSDGWKFTFKKDNIGRQDVKQLRSQKDKLTTRLDSFETQLGRKNEKVQQLQTKLENQASQKGGADISGTYFEVQIGAFQSFSFDRYGDQVTNLTFNNEDGMKKLTVGRFKEANAARAFRRDLVRMGVEDAFIVKKKNGKRVKIIESY